MRETGTVRLRAEHCNELVRRGPRPEERAELVSQWRRDLGRTLARELGTLLPGDRLSVAVSEPERLRGAEAIARIGPVAANSLLRCGDSERTALLSFDHATAIALTDRSFGGDGEIPQAQEDPGPDGAGKPLPRSAALLVDRAAAIVAHALAGESAADDMPPADVIVRSESASRLKPFLPEAPCVAIAIVLANQDGREWAARLAFAEPVFDALLPGSGGRRLARRPAAAPTDGSQPPFGTIPLPLEGVLAEFDLSLSRLERLAPGDTIALAVPGELPLRIGERVIGWGRLGTLGDRMAIRLTRLPGQGSIIAKGQ